MCWSTARRWTLLGHLHCKRISPGAAMSTGKIFQAEIEFLGDIVGREGLRSTEKHLDAVKHFGEVNDIEAMRRFLGAFGWVRKSDPKEVIVILPTLTAQLRKDALWPMPDAAQKPNLLCRASLSERCSSRLWTR